MAEVIDGILIREVETKNIMTCLLYTSDAADD